VRAFSNKGYLTPAAAPWLYLVGCVAICLWASLVVHRFLEWPMTAALRRALSNLASRLPSRDRPSHGVEIQMVSEREVPRLFKNLDG
jgi:peptidoglycan/LPS O-acetylase OafA/YrhL